MQTVCTLNVNRINQIYFVFLICLQHIELWVLYLWHFRPSFADWSIVSSYFLTLLLQDTLPLFYANKQVYKLSWADVDRVYISKLNKKSKKLCSYHLIHNIYFFVLLAGVHSDK